MSKPASKLPITAAEYLEGERQGDVRHEFEDGRVYVMAGAFPKMSSARGISGTVRTGDA